MVRRLSLLEGDGFELLVPRGDGFGLSLPASGLTNLKQTPQTISPRQRFVDRAERDARGARWLARHNRFAETVILQFRGGECSPSDHEFVGNTAYIHLKIETLHRWASEVPGQAAWGGSAADDLIGQERMDVENRVDLGRGNLRPTEAERRHPQLHRPEHEARFLAHRLRRLVAAPNDAPFIAGAALARFTASRRHKALRRAAFARHGIAKGVERRHGGRVDFGADIRTATGLTSPRKIPQVANRST